MTVVRFQLLLQIETWLGLTESAAATRVKFNKIQELIERMDSLGDEIKHRPEDPVLPWKMGQTAVEAGGVSDRRSLFSKQPLPWTRTSSRHERAWRRSGHPSPIRLVSRRFSRPREENTGPHANDDSRGTENLPRRLYPNHRRPIAVSALPTCWCCPVWCGLAAGLLEVGVRVLCRMIDSTIRLYGMSRHFVWLVPLTNLLFFSGVGGCLAAGDETLATAGGWLGPRLLCTFTSCRCSWSQVPGSIRRLGWSYPWELRRTWFRLSSGMLTACGGRS